MENGKLDPANNVDMQMEGTILILRIETDESKLKERNSASGKSRTIATTSGNRTVAGTSGAKLGLNMYRKL